MTDRFVCSVASEGRFEEVAHTASQISAWLLIEVHGAWGVDAVADSRLGSHVPPGWKADVKARGMRAVCIRPPGRHDAAGEPGPVRLFFVVAARPGRNEGRTWTRTVVDLADVAEATAELRAGDDPPSGWTRHEERVVVVCTNGKHDQCCANRGRPVARHLRGTRWADQVWECSHIGGDRFAANLAVLPDSLFFGRMEPDEAERLLEAHEEGRIELAWYRGRSTLRYVEQAVEQTLRAEFGVIGLDDVVILGSPSPGRFRARVSGVGTVEAVVERSVVLVDEALTCQGTPNQKVPRFTVTEISEVSA